MIKRNLWVPELEHPGLPGIAYEYEWDTTVLEKDREHTVVGVGRIGQVTTDETVEIGKLDRHLLGRIPPETIIDWMQRAARGEKPALTFQLTRPGLVDLLPEEEWEDAFTSAVKVHQHKNQVIIPALLEAVASAEKKPVLNEKGEQIGEDFITAPTFVLSEKGEVVLEAWDSVHPDSPSIAADIVAGANAEREKAATVDAKVAGAP